MIAIRKVRLSKYYLYVGYRCRENSVLCRDNIYNPFHMCKKCKYANDG